MGFDINGVPITSSAGNNFEVGSGAYGKFLSIGSGSIITRPNTPYMRGQLYGQSNPYSAGGGGYMLVTVDEQVGSCYNPANGLWTCPVAGYYYVQMGGIATGTSGGLQGTGYAYIFKNGGNYAFTHWNHVANWHYVNLSAVVIANPGDYFGWIIGSTGTGGWYGAGGHGNFAIGLLM